MRGSSVPAGEGYTGKGYGLVRDCPERAYELVRTNRPVHPVRVMARMLGVSASGFYGWCDRQLSNRQRSDAALLRRIRTIHAFSHGTYGAPRIHAGLRAQGANVSRKRVARLMREAGIAGISRRRKGEHQHPSTGAIICWGSRSS